jgi:hypothetical protein
MYSKLTSVHKSKISVASQPESHTITHFNFFTGEEHNSPSSGLKTCLLLKGIGCSRQEFSCLSHWQPAALTIAQALSVAWSSPQLTLYMARARTSSSKGEGPRILVGLLPTKGICHRGGNVLGVLQVWNPFALLISLFACHAPWVLLTGDSGWRFASYWIYWVFDVRIIVFVAWWSIWTASFVACRWKPFQLQTELLRPPLARSLASCGISP